MEYLLKLCFFLMLLILANARPAYSQATEDDDEVSTANQSPAKVIGAENMKTVEGKLGSGGNCAQPASKSCLVVGEKKDNQIEFLIEGATFPSGKTDKASVLANCPELEAALKSNITKFVTSKKLKAIKVGILGRQSQVPGPSDLAKKRAQTGEAIILSALKGVDVTPIFQLKSEIAGPKWIEGTSKKDDCEFTKAQSLAIVVTVNTQSVLECNKPINFRGGVTRLTGPHSANGSSAQSGGCDTSQGAGVYFSLPQDLAENVRPNSSSVPPTMTMVLSSSQKAEISFNPHAVPDRLIISKKVGGSFQDIYDSCFISNLATPTSVGRMNELIKHYGGYSFPHLLSLIVSGKRESDLPYRNLYAHDYKRLYQGIISALKVTQPVSLPMTFPDKQPFQKFTSFSDIRTNYPAETFEKDVKAYCEDYKSKAKPNKPGLSLDYYGPEGSITKLIHFMCLRFHKELYPGKIMSRAITDASPELNNYAKSAVNDYKAERERNSSLPQEQLNIDYPITVDDVMAKQFGLKLAKKNMLPSSGDVKTPPLAAGDDGVLYFFVYGVSTSTAFTINAKCQ